MQQWPRAPVRAFNPGRFAVVNAGSDDASLVSHASSGRSAGTGGDRDANRALHLAVIVRMRFYRPWRRRGCWSCHFDH
jgi:hypothetical protein